MSFSKCEKMNFEELTAITPIDGRYRNNIKELELYFSEYALIKYRVKVEIEYFIALVELPLPQLSEFSKKSISVLRSVYQDFTVDDAKRVKDIEKSIKHDVKSVEIFLREKFEELQIGGYSEFIHFGLTSQDINNTAIPLSLKDAIFRIYYPLIDEVTERLKELSCEWSDITMLARTHGQPASPTRLGKEITVFVDRLETQLEMLKTIPFSAKFGGATGNFNAHHIAYPDVDWISFANHFVNDILKLKRSLVTTQIEHYDNLAALFDNLKRINTILIDLNKDVWTYISMDYFKQRISDKEVGSSAMPHKVNPIDFENSEGNLGLANSQFIYLSVKLPVSRLQRDLTDSTVLRNIGVPFAHTIIAFNSLLTGLGKLFVNPDVISEDLEKNWVVVAEAIQTVLRREGFPNPFEVLRGLTRTNKPVDKQRIHEFIESLEIKESVKEELKKITPWNYYGI